MKNKYHSTFPYQLLILVVATSITGYSQDSQMKFMGFSMGMSSTEVINLLTSQDQISAFGYKVNLLSKNDRIELFKNKDTLNPYHENHFRFNCPSYLLGTPNPENYHNNQEFSHLELIKLIYNQLEIKNPSFVFEGDNLVGSTGNFDMLYSDYNELVAGLDKKYGKGVYNNRLTSWKKDGHVITLSQPFYEQWNRNKRIKIAEYLYKTTQSVHFQFYSLSKVQECINKNNRQFKTEENELIQVTNNSYKLLGLSLGITKEEFTNIIEKKGICNNKTISAKGTGDGDHYANRHEYSNIMDLRRNTARWDNLYLLTNYKNTCISLGADFTNNKLTKLTISVNPNVPTNHDKMSVDIYTTMKKFIGIQKPIHRELYTKLWIIDKFAFKIRYDSMAVHYDQAAHMIDISLINTTINIAKKDKFKSDVSTFIKDIDKGSLINLQILGSYFTTDNTKITRDYKHYKIRNQATTSDVSIHIIPARMVIICSGSGISIIDYDKGNGSKYFCYIDEYEVMKRNDSIISISFPFNPLDYGTNLSSLKKETTDLLINELNNKYGAGIERTYSDRKSIYWIISNKYIFEIILNGTDVIGSEPHRKPNIHVSFRLKESEDMILKHKEKKGLLD